MPAKKVTVGSLIFSSKQETDEYFRQMLYRYELGDKVSAKDAEVLTVLVAMHPQAAEKIGAGIKSFSVRSADYGTRCFWVNRSDGSSEKFSFRACY